jgi:hypothetical protein
MQQFKKISVFTINKGKVLVVENDQERKNDDFKKLIGTNVNVDGNTYEIRGVETFAIPVIPKGQQIGLLVVQPLIVRTGFSNKLRPFSKDEFRKFMDNAFKSKERFRETIK